MRVSGLELGGLVGSLIAGKASDWLISRSPKQGAVGNRVKVRKAWGHRKQQGRGVRAAGTGCGTAGSEETIQARAGRGVRTPSRLPAFP